MSVNILDKTVTFSQKLSDLMSLSSNMQTYACLSACSACAVNCHKVLKCKFSPLFFLQLYDGSRQQDNGVSPKKKLKILFMINDVMSYLIVVLQENTFFHTWVLKHHQIFF